MPSSRGSSQPRDRIQVSRFAGGFFTEPPNELKCIERKLTKPRRDFPDAPVVTNLPSNAGDMDSIPGLETKDPHAEILARVL